MPLVEELQGFEGESHIGPSVGRIHRAAAVGEECGGPPASAARLLWLARMC